MLKFSDYKQITESKNHEYIDSVKAALLNFQKAYRELSYAWSLDHSQNIDLNQFLENDFPFNKSFDDLDVNKWVENSIELLNRQMRLNP